MTAMDAGARAWLLKTAKLNFWRVDDWYEFDDLVQDGFVCWSRVIHKYETRTGRVRSRRHLMGLFKRTYSNHIHDLSKGRTRQPEEVGVLDVTMLTRRYQSEPLDGSEYRAWDAMECEGDAHDYERMVVEAPTILQKLLRVLLRDGPSPAMRAAYRVGRDAQRETVNERLCKLIGADPADYDYATALRSFLSP